MFCSKCGNQIDDNSVFCGNCGARQNGELPRRQEPANQYGTQGQQPGYQQPTYQDPFGGYPMKWWKFLAYFALWASAALNVIMGIMSLTGAQYQGLSTLVYRVFPAMKTADIIYGILVLALAVVGFITAYKILKLKKDGPDWLMWLYVGSAAASTIYLIIVIAVLKGKGDLTSLIVQMVISLVISVVMIFVNRDYFNKRKAFFVN